MKIILKCPGYKDSIFDSYEDLNIIWQILDNYDNCTVEVVYEEKDKKGD